MPEPSPGDWQIPHTYIRKYYNIEEKLGMFNGKEKTKQNEKATTKNLSKMHWYPSSISVLKTVIIFIYPSFNCHWHSTNLRRTLWKTHTLATTPMYI